MANKKAKLLVKKRKFHGNRFSKNESQEPSCHSNNVTSAKKLKLSKEQIQDLDDSDDEDISACFIFMEMTILKTMFEQFSACKLCSGTLELSRSVTEKMGFSHRLSLSCTNCEYEHSFYTLPEIPRPNKPGRNPFEVNTRSVMAFREIGRGLSALNTFSCIMNMPPPMTPDNFNSINDELHNVYSASADDNMAEAGKDVHNIIKPNRESEIVDCTAQEQF